MLVLLICAQFAHQASETLDVKALPFLAKMDQPVAAIFTSFSSNRDMPSPSLRIVCQFDLIGGGPMRGITVPNFSVSHTTVGSSRSPLFHLFGIEPVAPCPR
ncbi:unnamed protein product [Gemmata massiliana]|uniref:Uncharacterized protein n=1 Tax=Gemmata massiliana TaxID=1210884 RepID=A0A6P2DBY3_9BACT|nr:unnamed protein product [Gemmata massiliana]